MGISKTERAKEIEMKTYRMIVTTEQSNGRGATSVQSEITRHLTEAELDSARANARLGAPTGSTRTIRVKSER